MWKHKVPTTNKRPRRVARKNVSCAGVPQIPDDVFQLLTRGGEWQLSPDQEAAADRQIAEAMAALRAKRQAPGADVRQAESPMSKTATLKLETLHLIPGLQEDFDRQIEALVADCKAPPGNTADRALKVELKIRPHKEDAEDVLISPVITSKQPAESPRPNWRVVTVRIPIEKHLRYKRLAHQQGTSLNQLMVQAADYACDELEGTETNSTKGDGHVEL